MYFTLEQVAKEAGKNKHAISKEPLRGRFRKRKIKHVKVLWCPVETCLVQRSHRRSIDHLQGRKILEPAC
jgi:hypothetical protein